MDRRELRTRQGFSMVVNVENRYQHDEKGQEDPIASVLGFRFYSLSLPFLQVQRVDECKVRGIAYSREYIGWQFAPCLPNVIHMPIAYDLE